MPALKRFCVCWPLVMVVACFDAASQSKLVRMPAPINHPSINVSAPFISLDGKSILFVSDNAEDNLPTVFYSNTRDGVNWKEPVALPKTLNGRLNYLRGFALSPDGRQLYISTTKGGGLGGYDLYQSDQKGAFWSDPINVGLPINSQENEASPCISTEGTQMFFTRCTRMDSKAASGCRILMSSRKSLTSQWNPPTELPPNVNTGNSQTPRIMGDGETLIFASDKISGKGGMDLFLTRRDGEKWTDPIPLEFVNTPGDEQFVSATSLGRYLMKDAQGKAATELVEVLFPPEIKPKGVMKLEGQIQGPANLAGAYVNVFERKSQTKVLNTRPNKDGVFTLYMKEGNDYELTVDPEQDNYTFFSREYDLSQGKISTMERIDIPLKPVASGDVIELANVKFKQSSTELNESSNQELRKVTRLINSSPSLHFKIEVDLYGYVKDSLQSNPDLTEIISDTLHYTVSRSSVDSTGTAITTASDSISVKTTYHNDRTMLQALEVVNYLITQGAATSRLIPANKVFEAVLEDRKTLVRLIAQ